RVVPIPPHHHNRWGARDKTVPVLPCVPAPSGAPPGHARRFGKTFQRVAGCSCCDLAHNLVSVLPSWPPNRPAGVWLPVKKVDCSQPSSFPLLRNTIRRRRYSRGKLTRFDSFSALPNIDLSSLERSSSATPTCSPVTTVPNSVNAVASLMWTCTVRPISRSLPSNTTI